MKYYLYLDKDFLRSLFATHNDCNFDIEIMEMGIQRSDTATTDLNVTPNIDKRRFKETINNIKDKEKGDKGNINRKDEVSRLTFSATETSSTNVTVQNQYINIEDVTGIKNLSFYNNLIEILEDTDEEEDNICVERGYMYPCKLQNPFETDRQYPTNNQFFCINNKYVWVDANKLDTDLFFLSTISAKVKVIGYTINQINGIEIVKGIAIYI